MRKLRSGKDSPTRWRGFFRRWSERVPRNEDSEIFGLQIAGRNSCKRSTCTLRLRRSKTSRLECRLSRPGRRRKRSLATCLWPSSSRVASKACCGWKILSLGLHAGAGLECVTAMLAIISQYCCCLLTCPVPDSWQKFTERHLLNH